MTIINGEVAKILDPKTIVINKGSDDGITGNERFLIYNVGQEIVDPITNKPLGKLEVVCGEAMVEHVMPKMTTLKSFKKELKSASRKIQHTNGYLSFLGSTEEIVDPIYDLKDFEGVKVGSKARIIK